MFARKMISFDHFVSTATVTQLNSIKQQTELSNLITIS